MQIQLFGNGPIMQNDVQLPALLIMLCLVTISGYQFNA